MKTSIRQLSLLITAVLLIALAGCSDDNNPVDPVDPVSPVGPDIDSIEYAFVTVTPDSLTHLFPSHIAGDNDFSGNGPDVEVTAELHITDDGRSVMLSIDMRATETISDWTEAYGTWQYTVYTAPDGWVIDSPDEIASSIQYCDDDILPDKPEATGDLVRQVKIIGDTFASDFSLWPYCGCEIVEISFNAQEYTLRRL